jgi:hypothetical protein
MKYRGVEYGSAKMKCQKLSIEKKDSNNGN